MEKFSDRLDRLFTNLDESKQAISKVEKLFEESRDRAAEETRATGEYGCIYAVAYLKFITSSCR